MPSHVALDPDMPAADGVLLVLGQLADAMESAWSATVTNDDPEPLHDFRVAIRTTRVVLDNARSVLPPRFVEESRHALAGVASVTGASRDLDTLVDNWDDYLSCLEPEVREQLNATLDVLHQRRASARQLTVATISQPRLSRIVDGWSSAVEGVPSGKSQGRNARRPLRWLVHRKLQAGHERVLERGRAIDEQSSGDQLHDLRIDTKTLRYLVECYAGVLPKAPRKQFLQPLKVLQTDLGRHQDAIAHHIVVRRLIAESTRNDAPTEAITGLAALADQIERVRLESRAEFASCFEVYDSRRTRQAFKEMQRRLR